MKITFSKLNITHFMNGYVKKLGRRFYSPSLNDVAWLKETQSIFLIIHTFLCIFFPREPRLTLPNLQRNVWKIIKFN